MVDVLDDELPEPPKPGPDAPFRPPVLRGRDVFLRPVGPEDYGQLRWIDLTGELGIRWRFRGATPTADQWVHSNAASLCQFVIAGTSDSQPIGIATAFEPNFQDQNAQLALASFQPEAVAPLVIFGAALFIDYVFQSWGFHKLYLDLPEFNVPQLASGLQRLFEVEARLKEDIYYDGRRWDRVTLALYRNTWQRESRRILAAQRPRETVVRMTIPPLPNRR